MQELVLLPQVEEEHWPLKHLLPNQGSNKITKVSSEINKDLTNTVLRCCTLAKVMFGWS